MPKGVPKSGKRKSSLRTEGVLRTCERCGKVSRFSASVAHQREKRCAIRFCGRKCYNAANAKAPQEPKPPRTAQYDHKAYMKAYNPKWQAANRERANAASAQWARDNRTKRLEIQKRWRDANKNKVAQAAKLRRLAYANGCTREEIAAVIDVAEGHCTYCGLPVERLELDHVDPVASGGEHHTDNFLPACRTCNASKSDNDVADWLYEKHGIEGLARAVYMLENRQRLIL